MLRFFLLLSFLLIPLVSSAANFGGCQDFKDLSLIPSTFDCSPYPFPQWVAVCGGDNEFQEDYSKNSSTPQYLSYYFVNTHDVQTSVVYGPFDNIQKIIDNPGYYPVDRWASTYDFETYLYWGYRRRGYWPNWYSPDYDIEYDLYSRNRYKFTAGSARFQLNIHNGVVDSVRVDKTSGVVLVYDWTIFNLDNPALYPDASTVVDSFYDFPVYDADAIFSRWEFKRPSKGFSLDYAPYFPSLPALTTLRKLFTDRMAGNYQSSFVYLFTPNFPQDLDSEFDISAYGHDYHFDLARWPVWSTAQTVFLFACFVCSYRILSGVRNSGG